MNETAAGKLIFSENVRRALCAEFGGAGTAVVWIACGLVLVWLAATVIAFVHVGKTDIGGKKKDGVRKRSGKTAKRDSARGAASEADKTANSASRAEEKKKSAE